jgi:hypothetical protein
VAQIGQLFAATGLQPRGQDAVVPGLLTGFGGFGGAEAERPPVRASLQQGGAFGGSMEAPLLLGQRDGGAKQGMPQPTIGLLGRRMGLDGAGQYAGQWQHDDESRGQYERRRQYADEPDSRYDSRHGQYTDDSYWSDGQYEGKRPYEEDEEPRPHYGRYNEDEHEVGACSCERRGGQLSASWCLRSGGIACSAQCRGQAAHKLWRLG